jgi:hypothetical protein
MSAVKDQNQSTTFIYTNFYNLYRKSKLESLSKEELAKGLILKSRAHTEAPSIGQARVITTEQQQHLQDWTRHSLNSSFRSLRESRKRLQFLMTEIDEILSKT